MSTERYQVRVVGGDESYEVQEFMPRDWPALLLLRKRTGCRACWRYTHSGYHGGNWGQGQTLHHRHVAVRSDEDGRALGSSPTPEAAVDALHRVKAEGGSSQRKMCPRAHPARAKEV